MTECSTPYTEYTSIVLSGGSSKGILPLGALQYGYDNGLFKSVHTYVGVSVGALIAYLLIIGYTPVEIMVYLCTSNLMENMTYFNLIAMLNGEGASSWNPIHEILEQMTLQKIGKLLTMNDLKTELGKTLICITHNYTDDHVEYLSPDTYPDLPCLMALRMSANLPLIFSKCVYNDKVYIDGGISNNFPINVVDKQGYKSFCCLIKSSVEIKSQEPSEDENRGKSPRPNEESILEFIYKLMFTPIDQAIEYKIQNCTQERFDILRLSYSQLKFFNFNVPPSIRFEMFSTGYQTAKHYFNHVLKTP